MAVPDHSSISRACRAFADFVKNEIDAGEATVNVTLGNPENAVPGNDHNINVFFYRFEPSGFQADVLPGETWMVRCNCLITPFAIDEDSKSAGENDLRLLGEVMRLFHENPVQSLTVSNSDETDVTFQLQVIYQAMAMEELNQLWSTQGDITYRPSLSYEIALVPVIPSEPSVKSPLVGAWGMDTHADMDARYAQSTAPPSTPVVPYQTVNAQIESWAPAICFVHNDQCVQTLSLEIGGTELGSFQRRVWIAGDVGEDVELYWEVWDRDRGWRTLDVKIEDKTTVPAPSIDPNNIDGSLLFTVSAPEFDEDGSTINVFDHAGQAVLYAIRRYRRQAESDGAEYIARSNPLLISLYEVST
jgi:hypothetical protein